MMKRWMVTLASLSVLAGVIALAMFLGGVFDGDNEPGSVSGPEATALCAEDSPDCEDTIVVTNDAGDDGDGASIAPVCAPGFPDCLDMVVVGANGDIDDAVPEIDPVLEVVGRCAGDQFASCEEQAIKAALTDAEGLFGVDESEIVVESAAFQEWSNACLDAADDGEACAGVITPGFVVVIELEGTQYEYHTDLNGNARLAT